MRAVALRSFGLENLELIERARPKPERGQVLLRMLAASLNYRDLLMARGVYNPKQQLPLIIGSDGVGVVTELGEGVSDWAIGQRVCPIFAQTWLAGEPTRERLRSSLGGPRDGTLAEYMVVSAESVVAAPSHLTDEQAACLPCAAVTAWSALVTHGDVTAGSIVLTQGTGGVSIFAVQLAKALGARVIATSSSEEKLARLSELGADDVVNYAKNPNWGATAKELTAGVGVCNVIEVGGGKTLGQSVKATRPGGQISIIGVLSGVATDLNLLPILMQNIRLQGVMVGHRDGFEAMNRAIAKSRLLPLVDRTFALAETRAALEHMASGEHLGKICIRIAD